MAEKTTQYYVPAGSPWPVLASVGLMLLALGGANFIQQSTDVVNNEGTFGGMLLAVGVIWMIGVLFMWWRDTVKESIGGLHSDQMYRSYSQGMLWFIFSEVMFFSAFFFTLWYMREVTTPWLSDLDHRNLLWPDFSGVWPNLGPAGVVQEFKTVGPFWLPTINTALLLTSGLTLTISHHALRASRRNAAIFWLALTVALGMAFIGC